MPGIGPGLCDDGDEDEEPADDQSEHHDDREEETRAAAATPRQMAARTSHPRYLSYLLRQRTYVKPAPTLEN